MTQTDPCQRKAWFSMINEFPDVMSHDSDEPLSSQSSVSMNNEYPDVLSPMKREIYAPYRSMEKESDYRSTWSGYKQCYDWINFEVLNPQRTEVINVDSEKNVRVEDPSIEEIATVSDHRSVYSNEDVNNLEESDEKALVDPKLQPLVSSWLNLEGLDSETSYHKYMENLENQIDSLSLNQFPDVISHHLDQPMSSKSSVSMINQFPDVMSHDSDQPMLSKSSVSMINQYPEFMSHDSDQPVSSKRSVSLNNQYPDVPRHSDRPMSSKSSVSMINQCPDVMSHYSDRPMSSENSVSRVSQYPDVMSHYSDRPMSSENSVSRVSQYPDVMSHYSDRPMSSKSSVSRVNQYPYVMSHYSDRPMSSKSSVSMINQYPDVMPHHSDQSMSSKSSVSMINQYLDVMPHYSDRPMSSKSSVSRVSQYPDVISHYSDRPMSSKSSVSMINLEELDEEGLVDVDPRLQPSIFLRLNVEELDADTSLKSVVDLDEKRLLDPKNKPAKVVSQEAFVPLTKQEKNEVSMALSSANRRRVLVTHRNSNIEITGEILQCLKPKAWLNDEVINVYMELLKEREMRDPEKFLQCHFFNTYFYKKLISGADGYDFKSVRRWTTQRKLGYSLMDCDKIFIPVHKEMHWCLAVINKKDEKFQYLDSLGGTDSKVLRNLARYFVDEVMDKSGKDIDVSSWQQEFVKDLPAQINRSDNGMFMIKYADFYSRGGGLYFNQGNMKYFRCRTVKEILRLKAD